MTDLQAPATVDEFHALLRNPPTRLSKRLRECADLILEKQDRIAVSTLAELTENTTVQPSAFVRLCKHFGFSGFSELQRLYRGAYDNLPISYSERLDRLGPQDENAQARLWGTFVDAGRLSVQSLIDTVPIESLFAAAQMIAKANTVHVAGTNRAFAIACHLAYTFGQLKVPVVQHLAAGHMTLEETMREGDVLIAVTYAPYGVQTVELAGVAKAKGLSIIAITDMAGRGLEGVADVSLNVRERHVGDFRGLSASITLATVLAVFAGQERSGR